jgi:hypothetical protein
MKTVNLLRPLITQSNQTHVRYLAAKKPAPLTDAQIAFQKHTAELGFREKTSIKGTLYEFHDVDTSIRYVKSQGK